MTLKDFLEKKELFLTYLDIERNVSEHTRKAYAGDLNQFAQFWHELSDEEKKHLAISTIMERFLVSLYYKKLDKSSIARKFSCFTSFAKYVRTHGIQITLRFTRPRPDKKLPIYLSVDEMFHLLENINKEMLPTKYPQRDRAVLELLYATGIRCSEIINIRFCDLNMEEKTIRIMGKGKKERYVLFGEQAKKKIEHYLTDERPRHHSGNEYLFLNQQHEKFTPRTIQRIVVMFRKFLNIDRPITPHKIRHTFATHLLNQGADLRVVQELLGHASLSTTEKYTHVCLEDLARICDTNHPLKKIIKS